MTAIQQTTKDPLLQPLTIRGLTLKNRVMSSAHASAMDDDSMPDLRYQRYHEEKAKGGLALTMFGGSSNIAPDSPTTFRQLDAGTDRIIPYFQQFAERIHQHGAALMCQITHLGRRGDAQTGAWLPMIAPSPVREELQRNFPRQMDRCDIDRVVRAFGQAARRCREGLLDGLETLAGGHLIGQFLSPRTNLRDDDFGGSIKNRVRFALMVHEEIRRQVGEKFVVGMRLSLDEGDGGLRFDEVLEIATILKQEGAVDFFNCMVGRMDTELTLVEENMPGMSRPLAPFLDLVGRFRREIGVPVFHAARVTDVANARHAVREGMLDMVAMTRAHIADPEIVKKIVRGEENRIRPCIGASHCIYKKPHCIHNAASGRETLLPMTVSAGATPGKKVVVIGAGPAGMEAARVAAERGHNVVLFEAAPRLGGQILLAAKTSWRRDLISIVDWRVSELERLGVDVRCNVFAEADDVLAENPHHVFVATGGIPAGGDLPGAHLPGANLAVSSWDLLSGDVRPEKHVLICDHTGRHEAVATADHLSGNRHIVTLATADSYAATEMGYPDRIIFHKRLAAQGVTTLPYLKLGDIRREGNRLVATLIHQLTNARQEITADQVVLETGTMPVAELFFDLSERSLNKGMTDVDAMAEWLPQPRQIGDGFTLHRIGDALTSRTIHAAILEAYRLTVNL
ncbi:FAD-dependent oxidoreductase (plasmid) [Mesorhizobium mediterraneum]|uniref:N-methylproline demethylase n=1 Tax=Mesorhizobium mediterraneum TaxID=43617 RepID=A0AB36REP6_9HYPH|nr:NADH:flavin oxidoreductase [Mesorhizobium mediterraneum]PAQ03357.1 N-methylproline demethylase [Mesorhizobium mediterraneum]RWN27667.1 MAG: FAD-binding protein [Mesorhizobium sp.]WIW57162.1 FAD-dependent oxidoreductase [Mesorhizobium mediterraneum]